MQNSIWKLTALAGVIGVGFLIVLQAQDGLKQQDEKHVLVPAAPGTGPDTPQGPDGDSAPSLWPPGTSGTEELPLSGDLADNSEPTVSDSPGPDFGPLPDNLEPSIGDVAGNREPGDFPSFDPGADPARALPERPGFENEPSPTIVNVSAPDFGPNPFVNEGAGGTTNSNEPQPLPEPGRLGAQGLPAPSTLGGIDNLPQFSPEPAAPVGDGVAESSALPLLNPAIGETRPSPTILPGSLPEFSSDSLSAAPTSTASVPGESANAQALRLMDAARKDIDAGQLLTAREKVVAASRIPVVYGPLDPRPERLLNEIDALLAGSSADDAAPTGLVGLPEPAGPNSSTEPDSLISEAATGPLVTELPSPFPIGPVGDGGSSAPLPLPGDPIESAPIGTQVGAVLPAPAPAIGTNTQTITTESTGLAVGTESSVAGTVALPGDAPSARQLPELTIEKVAPAEATLSEPMIYSIHIANRGTTNAAKVLVEDQVPKGCRLVGTIPQAELIGTKLLWRLGRLPSGETKKILVKVVPIEEGEVGSIATVSFASEVSSRTAVRQPESADLRLSMKAPQQANVGQNVVFSFQIENTGSKDAEDVKLQDIIPVGFEHPAGEDLTYDVGTIAAGESFAIDLEMKAVKSGQFTNHAIVKADGARVESRATVDVLQQSGLTLSAEMDSPSTIGQRFTQRLTVTNETNQPVPNATITLMLPQQLRMISASDQGTFDKTTGKLSWSLPTVPPGKSITVKAVAVAGQTGKHNAVVQLIQPGQDTQSVEVVRTVNGVAALHLDLKDVPATAFPGDEFAVHVRLLNRGSSPDSNVQFRVVIPPELEFIEARGPVKNLPPEVAAGVRQVVFNTIPEIGEGASVDFEITLKASSPGRPKLRAVVSSGQLADPVGTEAAIVVIDTAP